MRQIRLILVLTFAIGCKYINPGSPTTNVNSDDKSDSATILKTSKVYENGAYCAIIKYYNPDTENITACNVSVEIRNNKFVQINSCDCNLPVESYFVSAKLDETGSATFKSNKGNKYTIQMQENNPLNSKKFQCDICGKDIK